MCSRSRHGQEDPQIAPIPAPTPRSRQPTAAGTAAPGSETVQPWVASSSGSAGKSKHSATPPPPPRTATPRQLFLEDRLHRLSTGILQPLDSHPPYPRGFQSDPTSSEASHDPQNLPQHARRLPENRRLQTPRTDRRGACGRNWPARRPGGDSPTTFRPCPSGFSPSTAPFSPPPPPSPGPWSHATSETVNRIGRGSTGRSTATPGSPHSSSSPTPARARPTPPPGTISVYDRDYLSFHLAESSSYDADTVTPRAEFLRSGSRNPAPTRRRWRTSRSARSTPPPRPSGSCPIARCDSPAWSGPRN